MLSPGHLCFESVDPRHHVVVAVCKGKVRVLVLDLSGDRSRMELYCTAAGNGRGCGTAGAMRVHVAVMCTSELLRVFYDKRKVPASSIHTSIHRWIFFLRKTGGCYAAKQDTSSTQAAQRTACT